MTDERDRVWFERFPPALAVCDQWVLWRFEEREGKRTKVPYQPNGRRASSTDCATWNSLAVVRQARWAQAPRWDGVGFVFSADDPFVGIDLDHARGEAWAFELIDQFPTYYEITPSWTGYHLIGIGTLPAGSRHKRAIADFLDEAQRAQVRDPGGAIEVYDQGRFFTMTGVWGPGSPLDVADIQTPLSILAAALAPPPAAPAARAPVRDYAAYDVLRKLLLARNGSKAQRLYAGDSSMHEGDESVADLAFLEQLCWYTRDPCTLDAIFRSSGRMREKWDELHGALTYGDMTIQAALARAGNGR